MPQLPPPVTTPPKPKPKPAPTKKATPPAKKAAPAKKTAPAKAGASGGGGTPAWFAHKVLARLGLPTTQANIDWMVAWESREGGHWGNTARFNPLNTTLDMPGSGTMNSVGVRVYSSWQQGIEATAKTLAAGLYSDIRTGLASGHIGLNQHFQSLMAWSGNGYDNVAGGSIHYSPTAAVAGGGAGAATGAAPSAGGGGGGGGGTAGGPSLNLQDLERAYGSIAALLKDTGLQKLVQDAVAGGWDDQKFTHSLLNTAFYKHHSDSQRNWLLLQQTDPGEASNEMKRRAADIRARGNRLGVHMNAAEVRDIAHQSLYNGVSDSTLLDQMVGAHFEMQQNHLAGTAGTLQDQYAQLADAYGLPVSHNTLSHWIQGSLTGRLGPEDIKARLIDHAKTMYPGLATQLDNGQTVADIAGYYRDSMSNLLELDPTQLSWRDPAIKKALQFQSDPTKPPTLMPLYQFEQQVRNDPRWLNTNNAKQSMQDVGVQILKNFGLSA